MSEGFLQKAQFIKSSGSPVVSNTQYRKGTRTEEGDQLRAMVQA